MEIHGSISDNLIAAVRSARKFKGHPVHADTLQHWADLLQHARRELATHEGADKRSIEQLVAELETELAERKG